MEKYAEWVEKISGLLQDRTKTFPAHDLSFEKLSNELQAFAEELILGIKLDDYNYDASLVERAKILAASPIFICGSMKSGTSLFARLLDFHPDLLLMPGDSYFYNKYCKEESKDFNSAAVYWIHRIVNPTGQEPFWFFGKDEQTFKIFLAYLRYFLNFSNENTFICVMMSFYVLGEIFLSRSPKKYWVEKTPHNELHAQELSRLYPKAKFIHVLRDPLDNIVSLKELDKFRGWKWSAWSHAQVIKKLFISARKNLKKLGNDKYLLIKYEDLTSDPSGVMKKVSNFLGISFDEVLLIPTENGKPAVSNSMFHDDRVKGVILNREKPKRFKEMSVKEIEDIVTILYSEATRAGYDWNTVDILQYKKNSFAHGVQRFVGRFFSRVYNR